MGFKFGNIDAQTGHHVNVPPKFDPFDPFEPEDYIPVPEVKPKYELVNVKDLIKGLAAIIRSRYKVTGIDFSHTAEVSTVIKYSAGDRENNHHSICYLRKKP